MRVNLNELRSIILEALRNAYEVLGLQPNASEEEIKKAWKKLALANHPDRGGSHGKMVDINKAKDRLLSKTDLFRYGPTFKGYDDGAPGDAATAPSADSPGTSGSPWGSNPWPDAEKMRKCQWCSRRVTFKVDPSQPSGQRARFVNHYTEAGGSTKCDGSDKSVWDGPGRSSAGGSAGSTGAAGGSSYGNHYQQRRYFTYVEGADKRFWEVKTDGPVLTIRFGRIGARRTSSRSKTYATSWKAYIALKKMVRNKRNAGWVEGTAPPESTYSAPPPPKPKDKAPAGEPQRPRAAHGRPNKDSYKVYPWKGARRVVRVGGKLFGTENGGNLKAGGNTKFNANDRVRVTPTDKGMKVGASDSDYTQDWDPIDQADSVDEVRKVVDNIIMEMFSQIAAG